MVAHIEAYASDHLRQRNLRKRRRFQRIRRDGSSPAQDAAIMTLSMWPRLARTLACRCAKARRYGARSESRSPVNVVVMMQNRDSHLHAEGDQRQADQSEACS
jgi:hypothetical protein